MQIVDISETTFASYIHNTVALKILSAKITPKKNLTLSPEFHGRAGEPGDKAREQRLSYQSRPFNTWNSCHTTNTSSCMDQIHYNSIVCRYCTSTERKSLPRPLLNIWERSVVWVVSCPDPFRKKSRRGVVTRPYNALSQRNSVSRTTMC